jgi:hypothetical protein
VLVIELYVVITGSSDGNSGILKVKSRYFVSIIYYNSKLHFRLILLKETDIRCASFKFQLIIAKRIPDWCSRTFLLIFNELAYGGVEKRRHLGKHLLDIEKSDSTYWKFFPGSDTKDFSEKDYPGEGISL